MLITAEDLFEYGRAKSLLIQDPKAKSWSEMKVGLRMMEGRRGCFFQGHHDRTGDHSLTGCPGSCSPARASAQTIPPIAATYDALLKLCQVASVTSLGLDEVENAGRVPQLGMLSPDQATSTGPAFCEAGRRDQLLCHCSSECS